MVFHTCLRLEIYENVSKSGLFLFDFNIFQHFSRQKCVFSKPITQLKEQLRYAILGVMSNEICKFYNYFVKKQKKEGEHKISGNYFILSRDEQRNL
jgi:hypothetical protein